MADAVPTLQKSKAKGKATLRPTIDHMYWCAWCESGGVAAEASDRASRGHFYEESKLMRQMRTGGHLARANSTCATQEPEQRTVHQDTNHEWAVLLEMAGPESGRRAWRGR